MYCISYVLLQDIGSQQTHFFEFPALEITVKYCKRHQPLTNQDDLSPEIILVPATLYHTSCIFRTRLNPKRPNLYLDNICIIKYVKANDSTVLICPVQAAY